MAACDDQTFTVTSSSNKFPGEESFNHRQAFCIIVRWTHSLYAIASQFILRKLSSITCADTSLTQSLERRHPGLCEEVRAVTEAGGCEADTWTKVGLGEDEQRIDRFEETILRYMRENTAVINIFIKQPYCELIIQDRYIGW